jgi:hypothetical protein
VRLPGNLGQQPIARGGEARQVRIVAFGDDEDVNGSLRIDVTECKRALSFKHLGGRYLPGHDFAEQAIGHGPILTCDLLVGPATDMVASLRSRWSAARSQCREIGTETSWSGGIREAGQGARVPRDIW